MADDIEIRLLASVDVHEQLDGLAGVLEDCVAGGASIGFMAPFSHEDARATRSRASPPTPSRGGA